MSAPASRTNTRITTTGPDTFEGEVIAVGMLPGAPESGPCVTVRDAASGIVTSIPWRMIVNCQVYAREQAAPGDRSPVCAEVANTLREVADNLFQLAGNVKQWGGSLIVVNPIEQAAARLNAAAAVLDGFPF